MIERLITNPGVVRIADVLENASGNVRLVGGCVRDVVLGRKSTDFDLATDLLPEDVLVTLNAAGIQTIPTGLKHGTITALVGGVPYEITTLRRDIECDGRHAKVSFTSNWIEDASRRDFTFNALYCDRRGKIHDYFSGIQDLHNRNVVFIGDAEQRINEDFLRILRAFRFHAAICSSSTLSAEIIELCRQYAGHIGTLSKERIRSEFFKLLSCSNCVKTLQIMQSCGVLSQVVPYPLKIERLSSLHLATKSPIAKLAAMLKVSEFQVGIIDSLVDGLRLSRKEKKLLETLLTLDLPIPLSVTEQQKHLNLLGKDTYHDLVIVNFLEKRTCTEHELQNYLDYADIFIPKPLPISGKELTELGYKEGKLLGFALRTLRTTWEKNPQITKTQLLLMAKELLKGATTSHPHSS